MPVANPGIINGESELQLPVSGDGYNDIRSDVERGKTGGIDARIGISVADNKGFTGAHDMQKFVGIKI